MSAAEPPPDAWEVLASQEVFAAPPFLRVRQECVRLPDGREIPAYYQVEARDFASVLALTPDGAAVMLRQYRHGVRRVCLTTPAGVLEPGETPLHAMQRELLEETGYTAERWEALGSYIMHGNYRVSRGHLFLARQARRAAEPNAGDLEQMQVVLLARAELERALENSDVALFSTVANITLAWQRLASTGAAE